MRDPSPPPLADSREGAQERLAHVVKDAARAYVRALQMRLVSHAVSYGHWSVLRALWVRDGLSQRELSIQAGIAEPTTFTAVKALETLGYVERFHLPGNDRKVHVYLTKLGKQLQRKLVPLAEEVNEISVRGISAEDVETTRRVLLAITAALAEDESAAEGTKRRVPSTRELGQRLTRIEPNAT
ncbi:homoprotocatechuate degradation operon regulator, HpaR (plasmid) [Variovorax sp. SRS16]|uniref:MarR family winged helix-turn-helix transcriptional regulator n=1 Tax=Variovorax sp. SRS16 TaxID=282217 RepID=UPI001319103C|nr:MarR family transcriptional regulator [Variovorax sp. SRS16]VTU46645.1 homoprotocatechuate degradation operon regulator, HpaR [Variovorax sp. SRS16]